MAEYGGKEIKEGVFNGSDYDWQTLIVRHDPITNRDICFCCWNNDHNKAGDNGCEIAGCDCICKQMAEDAALARQHKQSSRREKREAAREMLETSPFAANK